MHMKYLKLIALNIKILRILKSVPYIDLRYSVVNLYADFNTLSLLDLYNTISKLYNSFTINVFVVNIKLRSMFSTYFLKTAYFTIKSSRIK